MSKEFDPYTRDDLIAEVLALRLKYENEFNSLVVEATEMERKSLIDEKRLFIERTHGLIKEDLEKILAEYDSIQREGLYWALDEYLGAYVSIKTLLEYKPPVSPIVEPVKSVMNKFWKWIGGK